MTARSPYRGLSVGDGFMIAMTATPTEGPVAVVARPRRRGKSKAPNFTYRGAVSVIRLELDVSDEVARRRVEQQWRAVFRLRRALQHQPPAAPAAAPARTGSHHAVASAEQLHPPLGPPPNRPESTGRRGTSRKTQPPKLFGAAHDP
jgi:hypothetical protein